jgi:hypothetical protein
MTVHEIDVRPGSENFAHPTLHGRLDDLDEPRCASCPRGGHLAARRADKPA